MISNCEDLYNAKINPRINDLSLILLCQYYEVYLNPYIYQYELQDNSDDELVSMTIEVRFDTINFCHLLAIEKIMRRVKNREDIKEFKSEAGWNNIRNGKITMATLRWKETKKSFNSNKDKYVFFYLLPKLVDLPKAVKYDKVKVRGGETSIDCEILFHDQYNDATVHLGIKKNVDLGYYIPVTFFVERITESKDGLRYVGDQQNIVVTKINKSSIDRQVI